MIKYLAIMNGGGINILERQTAALTASQRKHNAHFSPAARWGGTFGRFSAVAAWLSVYWCF